MFVQIWGDLSTVRQLGLFEWWGLRLAFGSCEVRIWPVVSGVVFGVRGIVLSGILALGAGFELDLWSLCLVLGRWFGCARPVTWSFRSLVGRVVTDSIFSADFMESVTR
ncbi:hypothetical protein CFREI_08615 [Corynebacterium freiburgense]|nr:hypothetical protein CFREI_08615 [Corynebacterium freiburgense]